MDCRDIRAILRAGEMPSGHEAEAHLADCPVCRELAAEDGALSRALAAEEGEVELDVSALMSRVTARVAQERGPLAWLRSRPTPTRLALGLACVSAVAFASLVLVPRIDLWLYPGPRMALVLIGLAAPALPALAVALRPLARPPAPRRLAAALLAAVFLLPLVLALLPQAHALHPASLEGAGRDFASRALACFLFGAELGLPVVLFAHFLDRRSRKPAGTALLIAGIAGLAGNLALQLHCPITHPGHIAAGHASVGLGLAVVYLLALRLLRRAA